MKINKVVLFAYDFSHKKTQDFIDILVNNGYKINYIVAAPWQRLNISKSFHKFTPVYTHLIHPKVLAKKYGIPYYSLGHNSQECIQLIHNQPTDIYIISGARILSKELQAACGHKIINVHPGLLPEMRGLDTLLWSIEENIPIGISVHFLGRKIDAGILLYKELLSIKKNDTIADIFKKLLEKQPETLIKGLDLLQTQKATEFINLDIVEAIYHKKMTNREEQHAIEKFVQWRIKYAKG